MGIPCTFKKFSCNFAINNSLPTKGILGVITNYIMIKKEDIFPIGQTNKPHGIKGELGFSFTTDVFDREKCKFFILKTENIFVPFFIEDYRINTLNTGFVKFEDIENENDAKELSNSEIYLPNRYAEEVEPSVTDLRYFIGFEIFDGNSKKNLGKITDINDDTANILFELAEQNLLIPAAEEFITDINHKKKLIYVNLPEGLLEVNG
jgi:16S rRNA processing protein RimM